MTGFKSKIRFAVAVLFALLFLSSAAGKLTHYAAYLKQFADYQILPDVLYFGKNAVKPVLGAASVILALEIVLAAGLLFKPTRRIAYRGAAMLLFLFAVAMSLALMSDQQIDCGCFLPLWGEMKISWWLVLRNMLLATAAVGFALKTDPDRPLLFSAAGQLFKQLPAIVCTMLVISSTLFASKTIVQTQDLFRELQLCHSEHPGLPPGAQLPPVRLKNLSGRPVTVNFAEKPGGAFLLFFSSTCSHCKQIAPWWENLRRKYGSRYQFIGITQGPKDLIDQFVRDTGAQFPIHYLGDDVKREDFRVFGFPRTIWVDPKGYVKIFLKGNVPDQAKTQFEDVYLKAELVQGPGLAQTAPPPGGTPRPLSAAPAPQAS